MFWGSANLERREGTWWAEEGAIFASAGEFGRRGGVPLTHYQKGEKKCPARDGPERVKGVAWGTGFYAPDKKRGEEDQLCLERMVPGQGFRESK